MELRLTLSIIHRIKFWNLLFLAFHRRTLDDERNTRSSGMLHDFIAFIPDQTERIS